MEDDDCFDAVNVTAMDFHSFVYGMFAAYPTWQAVWQQFRLDLPRMTVVVDGTPAPTTAKMDKGMSGLCPNDVRILTSLCTQAVLAPVFEMLHKACGTEGMWFTDDSQGRMLVEIFAQDAKNVVVDIEKSFLMVDQDTEVARSRINTHLHILYSQAAPVMLTWSREPV